MKPTNSMTGDMVKSFVNNQQNVLNRLRVPNLLYQGDTMLNVHNKIVHSAFEFPSFPSLCIDSILCRGIYRNNYFENLTISNELPKAFMKNYQLIDIWELGKVGRSWKWGHAMKRWTYKRDKTFKNQFSNRTTSD